MPSYVHVYVSDVDAVYRKALAAGAESVQAPVKKADEDERGFCQGVSSHCGECVGKGLSGRAVPVV